MKGKKLLHLPLLLSVVIIIGIIIGVSLIKAQTNPPALVVHPSNLEINLTPGTPSKGTIFLKNTTDKVVAIQATVKNFTAQGEEGGVDLTSDNTPFSMSSWVKVTPEKIDIQAQQEVAFSYTITPPLSAEPGGHRQRWSRCSHFPGNCCTYIS